MNDKVLKDYIKLNDEIIEEFPELKTIDLKEMLEKAKEEGLIIEEDEVIDIMPLETVKGKSSTMCKHYKSEHKRWSNLEIMYHNMGNKKAADGCARKRRMYYNLYMKNCK